MTARNVVVLGGLLSYACAGSVAECEDEGGDDDVDHGDGQQELPAEAHELVVAEAGEGGADPDVEQEEEEDLDDEPEDGEDGARMGPVRRPSKMWPKGLEAPPKKSSVATQATVIMLAYSAMKNMANFMEEYSVW